MKNGYFIGKINPTFSDKPTYGSVWEWWDNDHQPLNFEVLYVQTNPYEMVCAVDVQVSLRTCSLPSHRISSNKSIAYSWNSRFSLDLLNWPVFDQGPFFHIGDQVPSLPYLFRHGLPDPLHGLCGLQVGHCNLLSSLWAVSSLKILKNIIANEPDTRQKIREILSWWWT